MATVVEICGLAAEQRQEYISGLDARLRQLRVDIKTEVVADLDALIDPTITQRMGPASIPAGRSADAKPHIALERLRGVVGKEDEVAAGADATAAAAQMSAESVAAALDARIG